MPALVVKIEQGYRSSSKIALVCYKNGMLSYIPASTQLSPGDVVCSGPNVELTRGNALPMGCIPVGTIIHNIELKPGKGAQLMRAAGTYAKIVSRKPLIVRLFSGKLYSLCSMSMATIGVSAGVRQPLRKAGESR